MSNIKNNRFITITTLTGLAMIAWQLLAGPLTYTFQIIFFVVCMFTLGIPHGAFDYSVEKEAFRRRGNLFKGLSFRLKYLSTLIIYGLFWYIVPQLSLLAFLLMSSWHFGETDLKHEFLRPIGSAITRLLYGFSVLLWIIFAHGAESHAIILHLLPSGSFTLRLWTVAFAHFQLIYTIAGFILVVTLTCYQLKLKTNYSLWLFFQLIIILSSCYFLPLLPAFALYFVGWHSVITLNGIQNFISGDPLLRKPMTTLNLMLKALPASILSIGILLLTGLLFRNYAPIFDPLPLLFVFLSLITLPHLQVMNKLNDVNKAKIGSGI